MIMNAQKYSVSLFPRVEQDEGKYEMRVYTYCRHLYMKRCKRFNKKLLWKAT